MMMRTLLLFLALAASLRAQPADTLVTVTLNIWHDQQDWSVRQAMILDTLRAERPDAVCLQEVLQKEGLPNQAQTLAEALGYRYTFASVDEPEAAKRYGNAILTPHRVAASGMSKLEPLDDWRVAAHARLEIGGRGLDVYCTHLHHTGEGGAIRATQLRSLLTFIDETQTTDVFLAGDFNAAPDAPELALLRPRFADAYAETHPEKVGVLVTTLNTALGHTPRRIDYLFYDRKSELLPLDTRILFDEATADSTWASDHFGVVGRFAWPR